MEAWNRRVDEVSKSLDLEFGDPLLLDGEREEEDIVQTGFEAVLAAESVLPELPPPLPPPASVSGNSSAAGNRLRFLLQSWVASLQVLTQCIRYPQFLLFRAKFVLQHGLSALEMKWLRHCLTG